MLNVHQWLQRKQESQSLTAIFYDAWYTTFGCVCQSNRTQLDARHYETRHEIPSYVLTHYRQDVRCTVH